MLVQLLIGFGSRHTLIMKRFFVNIIAASTYSQSTLPRYHQPANGLIPHRPIIDGQKLLADSLGNRVKTCAGAAGEDEAFHCIVFLFLL